MSKDTRPFLDGYDEMIRQIRNPHLLAQMERRQQAKDRDDIEMQRLIGNGLVDVKQRHNLGYVTSTWNDFHDTWPSKARFAKALERVGNKIDGRNRDGSWPRRKEARDEAD